MVRGKPFQKGHTLSKGKGRPPTSPEDKKLHRMTKTKFRQFIQRYLFLTDRERHAISEHPDTTALERIVLAVLSKAIDEGDTGKLEWLTAQLGVSATRQGTQLAVETEDGNKRTTVILNIPDNGRTKD